MMDTVVQQNEQRLTFRLLSYWNRIKGAKSFPSLADVNISEIQEMWHWTFTIKLGKNPAEHHFAYFGPQLAGVFGDDHTGETVEEAMSDSMLFNTIGFYEKVVVSKTPMSESSSFYMEGKEVRYRSLIVPLSTDGSIIDYIIGTTNYKMV